MSEYLASLAIPLLLLVLSLLLLFRRRRQPDLFDCFLEGAKEGLHTSIRLLPTLVALMVAVAMVRASGLGEALSGWLTPACNAVGIPPEMVSLVLIRPVSGSGSNAMLADLFDRYGPDSFVGLCASVLVGSSDTLIYILAVYFSGVGVRRTRHAFLAACITSVVGLLLSCWVCRFLYGEGGL